jgi:hypothetical protein
MDARVFVELVKELRTEQKEYYKGRNVIHLMEARRLEREVDKALLGGIVFGDEPKKPEQQTLLQEVDHEAQAE